MAKKTINITGTSNRNYDLDAISNDSRLNSNATLLVQVHKYRKGENPNPSNLQIGQIWLSKQID